MSETETRKQRENAIGLLFEFGSKFRYLPIPGVAEIRADYDTERGLESTDREFLDFIKTVGVLPRCRCCLSERSTFLETNVTDRLYCRPVCILCRDKEAQAVYRKMQKRGVDPTNGTYLITADQARDVARQRQGWCNHDLREAARLEKLKAQGLVREHTRTVPVAKAA